MFKNRLFLLLAVLLAAVSCSTSRRVSQQSPQQSWAGRSALEIIEKMGDPVRIDEDGRGGSVLVYESAPDYDDPDYDILDPDTPTATRKYAHFYLDREGDCYQVDANYAIPSAPRYVGDWSWLDAIFLILLINLII